MQYMCHAIQLQSTLRGECQCNSNLSRTIMRTVMGLATEKDTQIREESVLTMAH